MCWGGEARKKLIFAVIGVLLFPPRTGAVANESCLRVSPCVQFVDRFQHHLKGRPLTEPVRLVTFVETAVGLLNFKVNIQTNPPPEKMPA